MCFSHLSERHQVEYRSANCDPEWRIRWNATSSFHILDSILLELGLKTTAGREYRMNACVCWNIRMRFCHLSERLHVEYCGSSYNPKSRIRWNAQSSFSILDTILLELGLKTPAERKYSMNIRVCWNIRMRFSHLSEWLHVEYCGSNYNPKSRIRWNGQSSF